MTDQNNNDLLADFGGGRDYDYVVDWTTKSETELWHGYIGSVFDDLLILGDHERGEHVLGMWGDDTIWGGGGGDTLEGNEGNDWLYGEAGDDRLHGGEGNDLLYGGAGDDTIRGGWGDDLLEGGEGDDWLGGGRGDDTITGGAGDDELTGWTGDDTFVYEAGHGNDAITDFTDGEDTIDLSGLTGITGFDDLTITQDGGDARIDTSEGTITLRNFDMGDLDASDFVFAEAPQDGM